MACLSDFDAAKACFDLGLALTSDPQAHAVLGNEQRKMAALLREQSSKQKKAFAGIFEKATSASSAAHGSGVESADESVSSSSTKDEGSSLSSSSASS